LYFHVGTRFVTLESPEVGQRELNEVAKALEAHLR
jgi:hypothetical protein